MASLDRNFFLSIINMNNVNLMKYMVWIRE